MRKEALRENQSLEAARGNLMTWLDFSVLILFGGLLSLAYQRGVVLEITEFFALIVGGFMGFRLFRGMAEWMHSFLFKGWSLEFLQKASFFAIFIGFFLAVYSAGLTLERRMKEEHYIDKLTDRRAGLVVGFFKGGWMLCLLLGLFFYLEMVPPRNAPTLRRGPVVAAFLGLRTLVAPTVYIMAPSDLAKQYLKVGLGGSQGK